MEQDIFLIGVRHIRSEKKQKDFYMVDYVTNRNIPQTDYITIEEYNKIGAKAKTYTKCKGIFNINEFQRIYLCDIK